MKGKKRKNKSPNKPIYCILILLCCILTGIGYTTVSNTIIDITGNIAVEIVDGILISEAEYIERENSLPNESANVVTHQNTTIISDVTLEPNNSSSKVYLKVKLYNTSNTTYPINSLIYEENIEGTYSNNNIQYEINQLENYYIAPGESLDITIIFSYKEGADTSQNTLRSILTFEYDIESYVVATYSTPEAHTFTVPHTGRYKIELWGAAGGRKSVERGGLGGYVSGEIILKSNEIFYVYVGEYNSYTTGSCYSTNPTISFNGTINGACAGGGGATDIRLATSENWYDFDSLKTRIMVAGAGGGAIYDNGEGGSAGGLTGYYSTGSNGNPSSFGSIGTQTGTRFGYSNSSGTTTGGAGYYAGTRGGGANAPGGSSFISGHNGCNAITESSTSSKITHTGQPIHYSGYKFENTIMIDGRGYQWTNVVGETKVGMPTFDGTSTMNGNTQGGYAKITYLSRK